MDNHKIEVIEISLRDYKCGVEFSNDDYDIAAPAFRQSRVKALSSNPFATDDSFPTLELAVADDIIVGRRMLFPTMFKANEEIVKCLGSSFWGVHPVFQHLGVGSDLMINPIRNKIRDVLLSAELSDDSVAIYKAMKFKMFTLERMIQPHSTNFILQKMGFRGISYRLFSSVVNFFLRPLVMGINKLSAMPYGGFDIEEVQTIPEWVEDITLNDGHKYMEVHDCKWLQWNLDNMWENNENNSNRFYIVKKNENNIGFFMLKERMCDYSYHNIDNIFTGSVVEWGTRDPNILNEKAINILALQFFNPKIDVVNIYTDSNDVLRKLRLLLFFKYKPHHIAFKDLTKRFKDAGDKKLWRLRYGYSDSILN